MATSTIDKEFYHYFIQLNEPQKISLLNMVKTFVGNGENEDEMFGPITIEEYNRQLDEAEAEFERGEVISHEEVKKLVKIW